MCGTVFKPKRAAHTKFCGRQCGLEWTGFQAFIRNTDGGRVFVRVLRNKREVVSKTMQDFPPAPSFCTSCGSGYYRAERFQRYCTAECGALSKARAAAEYKKTEAYRASRRRHKSKRSAIKRGANGGVPIDPIKVFERDAWRCGICGYKTHKTKRGTYHPKAPELDHIVAIANGGSHTWDNVQCSCRFCNSRKGATDYGQIPMFTVA